MAYSDLDLDIVYVADNTTVTFPINFARTSDDQVVVELWNSFDPDNPVQLPFVKGTDWSIVGDDVVTTAAPINDAGVQQLQKILIYRDTAPIHETLYTDYEFPFATMNSDLDTVYQLAQENKKALDRTVATPRFIEVSGDGEETSIANNAADIAALEVRVEGLEAPTVVPLTAAQTYQASNNQIIILDTADAVQVNLPPAVSGALCKIKGKAVVDNKTVVAATGIDGFGTTYTLSSDYESLSLVSDGTQWYII